MAEEPFSITTVTAGGNVGFPVHLDRVKGGVEHARFRNQRTVLLPVAHYLVNVKVFANGMVQITGLKHPDHAELAVRRLSEELLGAAGPSHDRAPPTSKVSMMNITFSHGACVPLHELHRELQGRDGVLWCAFEPLLHPAVRVQSAAGAFKAFVFASGTVMLFGARSMREARVAAQVVRGWLRSVEA